VELDFQGEETFERAHGDASDAVPITGYMSSIPEFRRGRSVKT
jgi:hypothetical protein